MKYDLRNASFLILVKYDSLERVRNLNIVLNFLIKHFDAAILMLEIGKTRHFEQQINLYKDTIKYEFIEDGSDFFHRTKYLNVLIKKSRTDVVAITDADTICHPANIRRAYQFVLDGVAVSLPYSGLFLDVPESLIPNFLHSPKQFPAPGSCNVLYEDGTGGLVFFDKKSIAEAGYYNEYFKSWGHEDRELLHRMAMLDFQKKVVSGHMYHLHHPRYQDSHPVKNPYFNDNCKEYDKVKGMDLEELKNYIADFEWI
ncbi:hypothetical protein GTA51_04765 [Desulfovibrio aerotolerans]|uniref:Galactosyltransferase C-terminal domain-containing protein n=1 Tax=Solidesulfovibrio aerotolerans TaxID=295255 RepID=A0A7C9MEB0_9BACT|nr:galactosyltransferase-related protein [Solidesulfovibrio aerotolerans]MYL82450.1 hypothetical protein [Solidesulfovibrio aerotolerans]